MPNKSLKKQCLDPFDRTATALSITQATAFHTSCKWHVAREPVISIEENKYIFLEAQQVSQITRSTSYRFWLMAFCRYERGTQRCHYSSPLPPFALPSICPTSTIRDSNCSTDSGSLFCTVALIICFFIMLYLCNARWCLCNTPFSCLSHRSLTEKRTKPGT